MNSSTFSRITLAAAALLCLALPACVVTPEGVVNVMVASERFELQRKVAALEEKVAAQEARVKQLEGTRNAQRTALGVKEGTSGVFGGRGATATDAFHQGVDEMAASSAKSVLKDLKKDLKQAKKDLAAFQKEHPKHDPARNLAMDQHRAGVPTGIRPPTGSAPPPPKHQVQPVVCPPKHP